MYIYVYICIYLAYMYVYILNMPRGKSVLKIWQAVLSGDTSGRYMLTSRGADGALGVRWIGAAHLCLRLDVQAAGHLAHGAALGGGAAPLGCAIVPWDRHQPLADLLAAQRDRVPALGRLPLAGRRNGALQGRSKHTQRNEDGREIPLFLGACRQSAS